MNVWKNMASKGRGIPQTGLGSLLLAALFLLGAATERLHAEDSVVGTNSVSTIPVTMMYLTRTGERFACTNKNGKVAWAKRGLLTVGSTSYFTIERVGVVSLPRGTFECVMEQQHNEDGSEKRKVFRPRAEGPMGHHLKGGSGGPAAILIHVANVPQQLTGCIAPGKLKTPDGVDESVAALKEIFAACGGFEDGKVVKLTVRN